MRYYIDTEFLEGTQKERFPINLFRKETKPTIDLISIGIVCEDGREYYAVSKDFNLKEAWNRYDIKTDDYGIEERIYWIRDNVLKPIYEELLQLDGLTVQESKSCVFDFQMFSFYINKYGKSNKRIAEEIISFTRRASVVESESGRYLFGTDSTKPTKGNIVWDKPEFYAYYCSYDWVYLCWIFGKMINLPNGFPMYCNDLKQMLDERAFNSTRPCCEGDGYDSTTAQGMLEIIKSNPNYPKQTNEHSAIHDARWNKKLHEFLLKL